MNALFEAAGEVCSFMAEHNWRFCVIGGLAVQQWGEPRTTLDADFSLLTPWGEEEDYVPPLLTSFASRVPEAHEFALTRRVLLIRASNGKSIDIALAALPFEEEMIERALPVEYAPGLVLPSCTAEDLFIMKAFAGRPRDWSDAEGIASRQRNLDTKYILRHLQALCELKESPETFERARRLLSAER